MGDTYSLHLNIFQLKKRPIEKAIHMEESSFDNERLTKFGNLIRSLRKNHGLSQEKLGFLAGLDRTYIGGIERGERNISFLKIVAIADALKLTLGELFKGYNQ